MLGVALVALGLVFLTLALFPWIGIALLPVVGVAALVVAGWAFVVLTRGARALPEGPTSPHEPSELGRQD